MVPLTDAYALRGVKRYGLNYGPLRLWGSAAFVLGALVCGVLFDLIAARNLIWIIAARPRSARWPASRCSRWTTPDRPPGHRQRERVAARRRLYRDYRGLGADPGQPCRLLHFRVDCLATSRIRRTDDCSPVGAGRDCRDRAVRAVAAIHPAAVDAGGDRGTERGRALGDNGAGSSAGCSRDRPAHACAELRADAGRNHGIDAASRARPRDGARARLSDCLRRHRRRPRVDRVGHDLRAGGRASIT